MALILASDFIAAAYRKLGVLDQESPMTAAQAAQGFDYLEGLLLQWGVDETLNPPQRVTYSVGAASHKIGLTGASITATCPLRILRAFYVDSGHEYEIEVGSLRDWEEVYDKADVGDPYLLYFDQQYPLGTLYLNPIFTGTIVCSVMQPMGYGITLSATLSLSPLLKIAVPYSLAMFLAAENSLPLPQDVTALAQQTLDAARQGLPTSRGKLRRYL